MPQTASRSAVAADAAGSSSPQRLVSLDAFRGAVMALMVLVNDPGDGAHVYRPLEHAEWHGWTPTDVVFPSFLWIVGVAITLSLQKRLDAGASRSKLFLQAARRAVILFVLGEILYLYPAFDMSTQRIMGVLQRIAICYLIAVGIYLTTRVRAQMIWIAGLLISYWLIMILVPVPGYGAGRLDMEGNLAHYVDRLVLGTHNYRWTKTWDPEGVVSTIPAIATALLGIMAGHVLRIKRSLSERTTWMFIAGNLLIAVGLICDIWLPINKKLWTSSFALFMAGLDFVILAMFIWVIDGVGWKRATRPFVIMGMNAIAIYMASEVLNEILSAIQWHAGARTLNLYSWLNSNLFGWWLSPINASLAFALSYTLLMYLVAYGMYKRGWFLKV
jgi:predicted acyltransferase